MTSFSDFARANGLIVDHVVADQRWHRVPTSTHPRKRNGSYKLAADGRIGWIQDFASMPEPITWRPDKEYRPVPVDRAAIARRLAEERRTIVRATQGARAFYLACRPLVGGHPYLESHRLDMRGCYGLKIDPEGWLVVPVMKDDNLMSVQRIGPEGDKRFWPGASVKGGSYVIERCGAQVQVLCEGLATGLALFAAVPLARVIVAFDAGNLSRVQIPRRGLVCVAADNDLKTAERLGYNPGVKGAQEAATAIGCGVAIPECMIGSDWCDLRNERIEFLLQDRIKVREADIRRSVDAEILAKIMRAAKYLHP